MRALGNIDALDQLLSHKLTLFEHVELGAGLGGGRIGNDGAQLIGHGVRDVRRLADDGCALECDPPVLHGLANADRALLAERRNGRRRLQLGARDGALSGHRREHARLVRAVLSDVLALFGHQVQLLGHGLADDELRMTVNFNSETKSQNTPPRDTAGSL